MTGAAGSQIQHGGSAFRPDIEGLRALAVALVMLYHAGISALGGGFAGVDVFFVVSGFVITQQLLRELDRDGRVSLVVFYGRRAKRLLPAASLVIVVTAFAAWLLAPVTQLRVIAHDLIGSSLYVVNWVLAGRSVDYLAEDVDPSPVQHYWSLAVEEQFYLIWPLIILMLVWFTRRVTGAPPTRRFLAVALSVLLVLPSLAWAVHLTNADPAQAFFVTTTRLWELGIGALVAVGATQWRRIPAAVGAFLAWAGLVGIVVGALVQDSSTPWPAPGALLPVLATAAVIVGGYTAGRGGPTILLGTRPLVWVGGLSYSLYLWHWCLLSMAAWHWGEFGTRLGLAVVVASVVPAWLSYRWVEKPIRHARSLNDSPRFSISVGLNLTAASLVAGLVLLWVALSAIGDQGSRGGTVGTEDPDGLRGATYLEPPRWADLEGAEPIYPSLTPDPLLAVEDVPELYEEGCQVTQSSSVPVPCPGGDPQGELDFVVLGDSKIAQWIPALDLIAADNGWRMTSHTKSACSPADVNVFDGGGELYESCREWGEAVLTDLAEDPPDVVLISGRRETAGPDAENLTEQNLTEGYRRYWQQLDDLGIQVIVLSDSPAPDVGGPVYECVSQHPTDVEACSWQYTESVGSEVMRAAVEEVPGAVYLDIDPWICPEGTCPGVWRNIVTYRQGSHVTVTYVNFLAPALAGLLVPAVTGD